MDVWSFPSVPPHILMAWCSTRRRDNHALVFHWLKPESLLNVVVNSEVVVPQIEHSNSVAKANNRLL
jgi:hypothetical protein